MSTPATRRAAWSLRLAERRVDPVAGSSLMPAAGYALLRANTREELVEHVKAFLAVAGDGTSEVIQVMDGPPPKR